MAFFKCEGYNHLDNYLGELLFRRLHEKQLVGAPVFSVQVREVVNDTGLPDLQIDAEKGEVSFDWKGMLDQLMGEEHIFNTILSQRLGWHLNPGDDQSNLLEMHRKLARRSRLQRECRAKYHSNICDHYTYDEKPGLEITRQLRLAASSLQNNHSDENNNINLAVHTTQVIWDALPDDAIIYSGNSNPGKKPGSIPRRMHDEGDLCLPRNRWKTWDELPTPPSAADLFSPRPLPDLSMGRRYIGSVRSLKRGHGKRSRSEGFQEEGEGEGEGTETLASKRGKFAAG